MEVRSIPFSHRRIQFLSRFLKDEDEDEDEDGNNNNNNNNNNDDDKHNDEDEDEDEDEDGNNNNNNNNNDDDKHNDDDDKHNDDDDYMAVDDQANYYSYYDPYYVEEEEEEEEEEEVIDDFFRYIDDDIERRTILPLEISDVAGLLCTSFSIFLSIGGGIGPGAILVGVYIIVMGFPPKVAIPLSCITSLGISLVSTITNAPKRHPLTDRPMIDWDLILIMQPLTLFGAIAGTYPNKILAEKVLITLLVLLLSIIAHNTLKRARKMHYTEQMYIKRTIWAESKKKNNDQAHAIYPTNSFAGGLAEADPPFLPKVHSINSPPSSPTNSNRIKLMKDTGANSVGANINNGDNRSDGDFYSVAMLSRKRLDLITYEG